MLTSTVAGFLIGLTLIVAIGAQNAYVLRQGLAQSFVGPVVFVCAFSDLVLISAGVSGIGTVVEHAAWVIDLVRWLGVGFLAWYGLGSLRRALIGESLHAGSPEENLDSKARVVGKAVALTWLNPHVYLDTVLLIGSIATAHATTSAGRWWYAAGAGSASIVWFAGLGYGARLLAPMLSRPRAWQILDTGIGITMLLIAAKLVVE